MVALVGAALVLLDLDGDVVDARGHEDPLGLAHGLVMCVGWAFVCDVITGHISMWDMTAYKNEDGGDARIRGRRP